MNSPNMPDDPLVATILAKLDHIIGDVQKLEGRLESQAANYVDRSVFDAWQTAYDREIRDLKVVMGKQEMAAAKQEEVYEAKIASIRADAARPSQVPMWVGMSLSILTSLVALIAAIQ